jgi:hypothetical protein
MALIVSYVSSRGMTYELQVRVKKFFEYYLKIDEEKEKECNRLLDRMGTSLQREVKLDFYSRFLASFRTYGFSKKFLSELCLKVQEKYFLPEELIITAKEFVPALYMVMKGEVDLLVNSSNPRVLRTVRKGAVLCDKSFLT